MKNAYSVIRSLLRTEKGDVLGRMNKYIFWVDKSANKIDIRRAVQEIYSVKVDAVNVMNVIGKKKRIRYQQGMTSGWKKAIVTLKEGSKIEVVA